MNNRRRLCGIAALALVLAACRSGSDDPPPTPPPVPVQTYGATLTEIESTRVGDGQPLAVSGLPARGAQLTVR